jgi:hypothetical protein
MALFLDEFYPEVFRNGRGPASRLSAVARRAKADATRFAAALSTALVLHLPPFHISYYPKDIPSILDKAFKGEL